MAPTTRTQHQPARRPAKSSPEKRDQGAASFAALRHPVLLGILLVIVTAAVYAPVHNHPFINYDDDVYVTLNDHVKAGLTWQTVAWAFTTYDAANWHPLTWLSHATDYELFAGNAAGHHDHNLLLHLIDTVLLFWILLRATGYVGRSWMVAALFALHPINVETVVWIAERKNLLSMTFFLLALAAYGWYVSVPREGATKADNQRRVLRYLTVVFLYALALMAKPQVITFPFVLLLWDWWPLGRLAIRHSPFAVRQNSSNGISGEKREVKSEWRRSGDERTANGEWRPLTFLLLEKIPFLLMSAASALLTVAAQREGGGFNPDYNLLVRSENAVVSYMRYVGKAFWPAKLAPLYPHPGTSLPAWQALLALLVLVLISALVFWQRERRYLVTGWLWFLGTLVPMIGLLQVGRQAMADRYAYLPFVGLFIMVCWGGAELAESRHVPVRWIAVPSCVVLLIFAALAHRQTAYWSDGVALWAHTAEITSGNFQAEDNLGESLQKAGRYEEAVPHYVRAAQMNPSYPPAIMFLAVRDQRNGDLQAAIEKYQQVVRDTDGRAHQNAAMRAMALANMGHAYRELGQLTDARTSLKQSVELNEKSFQAWMDLGVVAARLGDPAEAASAFQRAMDLQPYDVGYVLLATTLEQSGKKDEAEEARRKAKLLTNDYQRAQQSAAALLGESH
jgi:protein O-mannosyl-transferase